MLVEFYLLAVAEEESAWSSNPGALLGTLFLVIVTVAGKSFYRQLKESSMKGFALAKCAAEHLRAVPWPTALICSLGYVLTNLHTLASQLCSLTLEQCATYCFSQTL